MDFKLIEEHGKTAQGKNEYLEYLRTGEKLTPGRAIKAQCYQCMNLYTDGKHDCEIAHCPLYPFMPYRKNKVKRPMTEKQKEAVAKLAKFRPGIPKTASASE